MALPRSLRLMSVALLLAGASPLATSASAETLTEALAAAYRDNPSLNAARAGLRATDEQVPLQKSAGLPNASVTGSYNANIYDRPLNPLAPERSFSATTSLSVPVYQGGRVRNAISAAKTRVEAGRADLRGTELSIFSAVVAAYMDVIQDQALVSLSQNNVNVLEVNLRATRDRFEVGDLTRTDVAQSESRLATARSNLESNRARLIASRERYVQLVGRAPVDLQTPPPLPGLPTTPDEAVDIALANNPDLLAARKSREAARFDVNAAKGQIAPTVSAVSSAQYFSDLDSTPALSGAQTSRSVAVGARVTVPLYQGGRPGALVRQSQAFEAQAMEREIGVEREIVAQARSFYASWQANNAVIRANETATSAAALSLEGVRAENSVGSRTILDILNAEQEAFNARANLVIAQRNAYVAGFSLLAAMGRVSAADLGLDGGALYDPVANYDRVKNSIVDWDWGATPKAVSSRTVDSPAQAATVSPEQNR
jgi:outer membrane protein